jgi:hypothetical protein
MRLASPDEVMEAAKREMLDGREPVTSEDYQQILNFVAHNIVPQYAVSVCRLMVTLYDMPVPDDLVVEIAEHQAVRTRAELN